MRVALAVLVAVGAAVGVSPVRGADEQHQHGHPPAGEPEKLGTVDFPVSCTAAVKPQFTRAVALLHSFAYEAAQKGFADVVAADPSFAMGYWGVAKSDGGRPEIAEARAFLAKAD